MSTDDFDKLLQSEMRWRSWALRGWMCAAIGLLGGLWSTMFSGGGDSNPFGGLFQFFILMAALPLLSCGLLLSAMAHHSALKAAVPLQDMGDYHTVSFHKRWRLVALGTIALLALALLGVMALTALQGI